MEEKKKEGKKKQYSVKDIAKAMVANMKPNMEDPDFLDQKERIMHEVVKNIIRRREEYDLNQS